jgi:gluconate 2-dehydrogenase alpha chain
MASAARQLGWHPFPGPAAIATQPYQNRPGCAYHGYCFGGGCHVNAKSSTAVSTIPKALETKRLQVVSHAIATAIEVDKNGRTTGVTYVQNGEEYFQPAAVVVVASFTYENARLLLISKSAAYPQGLSNNHGQVGKHYLSHNMGAAVLALFPRNINTWYGLPAQGTAVDDWADDNFDHSNLDFIGGGNLWIYTERRPIAAANMPIFGSVPRWGAAWKAYIHENADRWTMAYLQKTTLPYEDNYLDLDPVLKDPRGFPVIRITAEFKENERKVATFIQDKMEQWFRAAGATNIQRAGIGTMGSSSHSYGSTRMGDNPETNVVNRWGLSHEVPNLAVVGSSVMGTSGARNPTLTAQALAWRTADYIVKSWKSISA